MKKTSKLVLYAISLLLVLPTQTSAAVNTEKPGEGVDSPHVSVRNQYSAEASFLGGTPASIIVVGASGQEDHAQAALSRAISRAQAFDREFFTAGGIETQLNALPKGKEIQLSPDGYAFLDRCIRLASVTNGWFDITGPSQKNLFSTKDWRRVKLHPATRTISLTRNGMAFDLRRIAPAYITDLMIDTMQREGYADMMVEVGPIHRNSGKDIFTPWYVSIGFGEKTETGTHRAYNYNVTNVAAATVTPTGLGEGLIDPHSKKPVRDGWMRSTTIFAAQAMTATAYALAAYTLGPKVGLRFIEAHPETQGILVDGTGNLFASKEFSITPLLQTGSTQQQMTSDGGSHDLTQPADDTTVNE